MQISYLSNEELIGIAGGCETMAKQFDKESLVTRTLTLAAAAIRELLFYRRIADQPHGGETIYVSSPADAPDSTRPGEPLPRPFVVAIMPYAKWLVLKSSAERVTDAEATAKAMTESSQRNADLADSFEKQLVAERAKNTPVAINAIVTTAESEESWQAAAAMHQPKP